jgi:hypothetical protein
VNELSQYFEAFSLYASTGELHRGDGCSGWFSSELDTWHPCGTCNPKGRRVPHPEDPCWEDPDFDPSTWQPEPEPTPPVSCHPGDDIPF